MTCLWIKFVGTGNFHGNRLSTFQINVAKLLCCPFLLKISTIGTSMSLPSKLKNMRLLNQIIKWYGEIIFLKVQTPEFNFKIWGSMSFTFTRTCTLVWSMWSERKQKKSKEKSVQPLITTKKEQVKLWTLNWKLLAKFFHLISG